MATLREVFVAALRSLLRGKSLIQAILAYWTEPSRASAALKDQKAKPAEVPLRTITDFLDEVRRLVVPPSDGHDLKDIAAKLKVEFRQGLSSNPACMLPSYNQRLPNGSECGQHLVLDVGGSTLRVALVELRSRGLRGSESGIVRMDSFRIDNDVKLLEGMAFFDWVADRVFETISKDSNHTHSSGSPLPMGLAWSFPIEQTSHKGGRLHGMGKGFLAANGLIGQDLGDIIKFACKKKGLDVELSAIVNDSTATLLSEAYINPSTRFGLILGTGVNIAAHLPIPTIGEAKYGSRPDSWFDKATHVVVNTELGMFGNGALPLTRWDRLLKAAHPRPDFQPLEQLVSGYYIGEMCRHALVEAISTTGIFGGVLPPSLAAPYSLNTETLSVIEADVSPSLGTAISTFKSRHPSTVDPTVADLAALRTISSAISRRSASIVAASLFALWQLKSETEDEYLRSLTPTDPLVANIKAELEMPRTMISFNGSVIENYPHYLTNCQKYIDDLITSVGGTPGTLDLVAAKESSLLGAAVALALPDECGTN